MKRHLPLLLILLCQVSAADSGVKFTCVQEQTFPDPIYRMDATIEYDPATSDVGSPGLIWVSMVPPGNDPSIKPVFYTLEQRWLVWDGGLYQPAGRFDQGLPGVFSFTTTMAPEYYGWQVYAGHGILTEKAKQIIAYRRAFLNSQREARIAAGTWRVEYESDELPSWTLVQKDAKENQKYTALGTVPPTLSDVCKWRVY